jgi:flagellin
VSSRLAAQVQRIDAASKNITNAQSFLQTQDGYLGQLGTALNRMSELAILAQDSTKGNADRGLYQAEFGQLAEYVSETGTKDFNGLSLFSGAVLDVTIDPEGTPLAITGIDLGAGPYAAATAGTTSVATTTSALAALALVKAAIDQLATDRANLGAYESRLNYTAEQLTVSKQNLTAAKSRITDVDVANESTEYAKENILLQSGTAMLAQANQLPQTVLKLLQ